MPMAVAQRYARALAEAAGPDADYTRLARELDDFASAYQASAELREVLASPAVSPSQKSALIETLAKRLGSSEVTSRFLRVLLAHYRLPLLDEIRQAFRNYVQERLGVLTMSIVSASPLPEDERAALSERFSQLTRKKVEIDFQVDPTLLGGLRAQVRSTVYDGSVRGFLDRVREHLEAG